MRYFLSVITLALIFSILVGADEGVQVQYIERPELALAKRIEMIRRATKSIDIETFSVSAEDSSAHIIMNEIIKKVEDSKKKGSPIKVRVMTDGYTSWRWNPSFSYGEYADELEKKGIEFKVFNKINLLVPSRANKRDHRKVMVIDGKEALIGGRNISDNFYGLGDNYNFKDTDFWLKTDKVKDLVYSIDMFWNSSFAKKPQKDKENSYTEASKQRVDDALNLNDKDKAVLAQMERLITAKEGRQVHQCPNFDFISDEDPDGWFERKVNKELIARLKKAEKKIVISNYLFLPLYELKEFFTEAGQKLNFDVDVLTNAYVAYPTEGESNYIGDAVGRRVERFGKTFNIYLHDSSRSSDKWSSMGSSKDAILHHKNFVIDEKTVIGGSYNVHPRSKYSDSEIIIVFENCPALAKDVEGHIRQLMIQASKWSKDNEEAFYCESKKKSQSNVFRQMRDFFISELAIQFF